jgi:subtilisin family serine protease
MPKRSYSLTLLLALLLLLLAPAVNAQTTAKKKVTNDSDLPRFTYPMTSPASAFLQSDSATFNTLAAKVKSDLDSVFRDYDIDDKSTLRTLLSAKLDLQILAGEYQSALETVQSLRAVQEKPDAKLTTGLFTRSALQAAIDTKSTTGPAFEQAFKKHFQNAIDRLPWDVVQVSIKAEHGDNKIFSKGVVLGTVKTDMDPPVQKSGVLDNQQAWTLISFRNAFLFDLPLRDARIEVLKHYIATHNVVKPDIWQSREVTLTPDQKLTPVLAAVWDSGVDVSLYEAQLFNDPNPTASGTHGLAYDDEGNPSSSWLYPLTPAQQQRYPGLREELQGVLDLENGIESPEANAIQKKANTLSADELHEIFELNHAVDFYIHGTHVTGIVARGNPAARLVVARFNDRLPDLPFPPTPEWEHQMAAAFQQMSDYFRTRNVRVVNMSWADDPQEFETWLSNAGQGADPAERKKHAAELFTIWHDAVESAIKNAPNTLFVCAAGNSNSNAGFLEDVPASLKLPNLITVGSVNQAGEETSFTSYGDTVVVYANGYEVESYIPGGSRLRMSGTSMASPNVANLAAKLFALDPSLTPAQAITLIKQGATASPDDRRHLIDPKRTVALLQSTKRPN